MQKRIKIELCGNDLAAPALPFVGWPVAIDQRKLKQYEQPALLAMIT